MTGGPLVWLWAHPRSRSTAVERMMLERGDVTVLHEPLVTLLDTGAVAATDGAGGTVVLRSVAAVLEHAKVLAADRAVFVKDTTEHPYADHLDAGLAAGITHTFIVREPRATIASHVAVKPHASRSDIGFEHQHAVFTLAWSVTGCRPVVLDADRLVRAPDEVVAAYCAAVGLPFRPDALHWPAGDRPEWHRTREWHRDAGASTGFAAPNGTPTLDVQADVRLRAFYDHHRPFYDRMVQHAL